MGRRNVFKLFLNKACLSSAASGNFTLESWDAIAHTEAEENCRIYGVKLGRKMGVTHEIKDGTDWPQLKCNVRKIEPVLFKKDRPLREWAAAKLLEYEFKRCAIESQVFAAKQRANEETTNHSRLIGEEISKEKQQHDDSYNVHNAMVKSIATVSRELNALTPTVEAVISKVEAGRKQCQKLEHELGNERANRASKLTMLDKALKTTNRSVEELSEQNRDLKEEVRRLKAAIKDAKKNKMEK